MFHTMDESRDIIFYTDLDENSGTKYTIRREQNWRHFANNIFIWILRKENVFWFILRLAYTWTIDDPFQ